MSKKIPKFKTIDGKRYKLAKGFDTKTSATRQAKTWRKVWRVRIVPISRHGHKRYYLYVRKT